MLCWVHEGRPYKKLTPYVAAHQTLRDEFLTRFWDYYRQLRTYQQRPDPRGTHALECRI